MVMVMGFFNELTGYEALTRSGKLDKSHAYMRNFNLLEDKYSIHLIAYTCYSK